MPRIRPLTEDEVDPESREYFQRGQASFGTVLQSTGLYAYCPPILAGTRALSTAIERSEQLPRELRCLLNIRAASMVGCPF